jgi:hypothetical protein
MNRREESSQVDDSLRFLFHSLMLSNYHINPDQIYFIIYFDILYYDILTLIFLILSYDIL